MDFMKCLLSKGHYYSLSDGLYPINNHTACALALYFKNNIQIKSFHPISVNNTASNIIVQLNPNQYLLAVIKGSPIKCRCPRNTENNIIWPLLAIFNLPKGCTIYSMDFSIPAVKLFSFKLPITLEGYQLDLLINKSDPLILINFKIMSDFGLNNLAQMRSDFILSKWSTIRDLPNVDLMKTLKQIDNAYNHTLPIGLL